MTDGLMGGENEIAEYEKGVSHFILLQIEFRQ